MGQSIGGTLDFIDGSRGALDLLAALAGVGAPLRPLGLSLGKGLGEGLGGPLDLMSVAGGALQHVAALAGVRAPLRPLGLSLGDSVGGPLATLAGVLAPLRDGSSLDGGGSDDCKDDGDELHFVGLGR